MENHVSGSWGCVRVCMWSYFSGSLGDGYAQRQVLINLHTWTQKPPSVIWMGITHIHTEKQAESEDRGSLDSMVSYTGVNSIPGTLAWCSTNTSLWKKSFKVL